MHPEFKGWPKIPRWLNETYVITEKIDGTNACIVITGDGDIFAQSRSKFLDESKNGDNHGFCKWVMGNKSELMLLGEGYHFGEWWGHGIQRNYGLTEKRFSLFNIWHETVPSIVHKVPVLHSELETSLAILREIGSMASPGYRNPEGLVMSSTLTRVRYKVLLETDGAGLTYLA
jgi:hypothetical protein